MILNCSANTSIISRMDVHIIHDENGYTGLFYYNDLRSESKACRIFFALSNFLQSTPFIQRSSNTWESQLDLRYSTTVLF